MQAIKKVTSSVVAILKDNIDTGQLVPRTALKATDHNVNYADRLFYGTRYLASGAPNPDFPLNDPAHQNAEILVTGENFGCGSSWEHAAWALKDYGFKVVIAKSFNSIFYMNALNNGLLPLTLSSAQCEQLATLPADAQITVDLAAKIVQVSHQQWPFEIETLWQEHLLKGIDDITFTESYQAEIERFESRK